ncbi:ATP-binding cassette domain-containing protein [Saccharopolyspora sp. CA-218241]|uniref:ABC transporter ATP-binding protein n=1 Tax=Saccharopolyspora sp. CA-218241 TaxID=3240027 RepID=UPI003D97CB6D
MVRGRPRRRPARAPAAPPGGRLVRPPPRRRAPGSRPRHRLRVRRRRKAPARRRGPRAHRGRRGLPGARRRTRPALRAAAARQTRPGDQPARREPGRDQFAAGAGAVQDAAGSLGQRLARDLPRQVAVFRTEPVSEQLMVSGVPRARLSVASVPGQPSTGEAVLFTKLYDVAPDGGRTLIGNAVSPLRVTGLPPDGTPVEVSAALPGVVHPLESGHRLELAVATTDQAYAVPKEPAVHRIGLAGAQELSVPSVRGTTSSAAPVPAAPLIGIGALALIALSAWVVNLIRRRSGHDVDPLLQDTPLVISDLAKSYPDKPAAVRDLSMRAERGRIVGLLGPNGAGKTTTLRMLLGLLRPTAGQIRVFGHRVVPGAPVLSRIGSLVESPGFLPHLSGIDNLRAHWASTGRPVLQARFDEVLRIAGLGDAAQRRVRGYSQGMRQRLAIAQAMLGMPDLLVLDEPTNGLDPPQIHRMREILRRYAATGRTVLISSHLLAEVEQTCSHVVVVRDGEVVASGAVEEIMAAGGEATFRVDDPEVAEIALQGVEGIGEVTTEGDAVHVDLGGNPIPVAVNLLVAAGVEVHQAGPRRRLEDAFLQLVGEETR